MTTATTDKTLAEIRAIAAANRAAGKNESDGLESYEIGRLSRARMFGDNDEAFPSADEWSSIVD